MACYKIGDIDLDRWDKMRGLLKHSPADVAEQISHRDVKVDWDLE